MTTTIDLRHRTETDPDFVRVRNTLLSRLHRSVAQYLGELRAGRQEAQNRFVARHVALLADGYRQAQREGVLDYAEAFSVHPQMFAKRILADSRVRERLSAEARRVLPFFTASVARMAVEAHQVWQAEQVRTLDETYLLYNPYHDEKGRFATAGAAGGRLSGAKGSHYIHSGEVAEWTKGNASGVPSIGYHAGIKEKIDRFKREGFANYENQIGTLGAGLYLHPHLDPTQHYGSHYVRLAIRLRNPYHINIQDAGEFMADMAEKHRAELDSRDVRSLWNAITKDLRAQGHDGVIMHIPKEWREHGVRNNKEIVVFDPHLNTRIIANNPTVRTKAAKLSELFADGDGLPTSTNQWQQSLDTRLVLQADVTWSGFQAGGVQSGIYDNAKPFIKLWWVLEPLANHCPDCPDIAARSPYDPPGGDYGSNILTQTPGDGQTACGANCKCDLQYGSPDDGGDAAWNARFPQGTPPTLLPTAALQPPQPRVHYVTEAQRGALDGWRLAERYWNQQRVGTDLPALPPMFDPSDELALLDWEDLTSEQQKALRWALLAQQQWIEATKPTKKAKP